MLYRVLRVVTRIALRWFYSRVDAVGVDRIPETPVLLVVNHPNAVVDAFVVASVLPRRLVFTGKATLFDIPLAGWFLRLVGVVPLIRLRDVQGTQTEADAQRNARAFSRLTGALASGGAVMIFPEGITGDHLALAPLRTGAARIALQARDAGLRNLTIMPVGLTFERKDTPRTRVFVQVGDPIAVDDWPRTGDDGDARALTAEIDSRLRAVTLNFDSAEEAARSSALATLLARMLRATEGIAPIWPRYLPLSDEVAVARRLEDARNRLASMPAHVRTRVDALLERLDQFRQSLREHRVAIEDVEIELDAASGVRFALRETLIALVAAPFAVWGWLNHWVPFNAARLIALRRVPTAADVAMHTILTGLAFLLAVYALQGWLVWWLWGWAAGVTYVVSLPVTADINFQFRARLTRALRRARVYVRFRSRPDLQARLRGELQALRDEAITVGNLIDSSSKA